MDKYVIPYYARMRSALNQNAFNNLADNQSNRHFDGNLFPFFPFRKKSPSAQEKFKRQTSIFSLDLLSCGGIGKRVL